MPLITSSFRINFQFNLLILNMIFHLSHVIDLICNLIQFIMRWTRSNCMFIPFVWRSKVIVCCCHVSSELSSIVRAQPDRKYSPISTGKVQPCWQKQTFWLDLRSHFICPHISAVALQLMKMSTECEIAVVSTAFSIHQPAKVQRDKWAGWTGNPKREQRMI